MDDNGGGTWMLALVVGMHCDVIVIGVVGNVSGRGNAATISTEFNVVIVVMPVVLPVFGCHWYCCHRHCHHHHHRGRCFCCCSSCIIIVCRLGRLCGVSTVQTRAKGIHVGHGMFDLTMESSKIDGLFSFMVIAEGSIIMH